MVYDKNEQTKTNRIHGYLVGATPERTNKNKQNTRLPRRCDSSRR